MSTRTAPATHPDVRARLDTLTAAQSDVLRLLACGCTPSEVARLRDRHITSVYSQVRAISKKLGLTWAAGYPTAVALAWRSGWITVTTTTEP